MARTKIRIGQISEGEEFIQSDGSVYFEADQSMGGNKLTDIAVPVVGNDAVRKVDLDTVEAGLSFGLGNKVDKITGKGLSTEDYSAAEKTKLAGVEAGANNYSHPVNHAPSIITQDVSNRFVTDTEISNWDGKEPGNTNIQTHVISAHAPSGATVGADWNTNVTNKPTLGTAADKNIPAVGDASATEVVFGTDTRLTNPRNAVDVSAWAKAGTKPSYTATEVGAEESGAVSTHAALATGIHGVGASSVESIAGSASKVTAHDIAITGVHGVGASSVESIAGSQAKVDTHEGAADPHVGYQKESEKGAANGFASLDANSKVSSIQLPAMALTDVDVVASQAAQLALVVQEGDVAIRTDLNKSFIHNGGVLGTMADWNELLTPTDTVLSVDGRIGAVTLSDLYAPIAKGVTNGDTHDHVGGDGAQIVFSGLGGIPTTLAGYGIIDAASDAELAAHEADTTNIHGFVDTADVALKSGVN